MGDRVLLGMSGGVDSAAAAVLLRQAGCEPVGCTLRLVSSADIGREGSCCSLEDVEDEPQDDDLEGDEVWSD